MNELLVNLVISKNAVKHFVESASIIEIEHNRVALESKGVISELTTDKDSLLRPECSTLVSEGLSREGSRERYRYCIHTFVGAKPRESSVGEDDREQCLCFPINAARSCRGSSANLWALNNNHIHNHSRSHTQHRIRCASACTSTRCTGTTHARDGDGGLCAEQCNTSTQYLRHLQRKGWRSRPARSIAECGLRRAGASRRDTAMERNSQFHYRHCLSDE